MFSAFTFASLLFKAQALGVWLWGAITAAMTWLFTTKQGRIALSVLLVIGAMWWSFNQGEERQRLLCQEDKARSELAAVQRDLDELREIRKQEAEAHKAAIAQEKKADEELASELAISKQKVQDYENFLSSSQANGDQPNGCKFGPDDIERMR